jgi:hypothetical protein
VPVLVIDFVFSKRFTPADEGAISLAVAPPTKKGFRLKKEGPFFQTGRLFARQDALFPGRTTIRQKGRLFSRRPSFLKKSGLAGKTAPSFLNRSPFPPVAPLFHLQRFCRTPITHGIVFGVHPAFRFERAV